MDDTFGNSEYPFYFIEAPVPLQRLTTTRIAINLLQYANFGYDKLNNHTPTDSRILGVICKNVLSVPCHFENIIDEEIQYIYPELQKWTTLNCNEILIDRKRKFVISKCFDNIVCKPNGAINFRASAERLIQDNALSDVEKYKIACTYCLEDEVRKIWPLVSNNSNVIGDHIHKSRIISYWNYQMGLTEDKEIPIIGLLNDACKYNVTAFEYFWDQLTDDDKVYETIPFIGLLGVYSTHSMIRILPKLNKSQAQIVFQHKSVEIAEILIQTIRPECFHNVLKLWTQDMKNITFQEDIFRKVIQAMTKKMTRSFNSQNKFIINKGVKIGIIMNEIWNEASAQLKYLVVDESAEQFFSGCHFHPNYPRNVKNYPYFDDAIMTYASNILTYATNTTIDRIFRNYISPNLIFYMRRSHAEKILKLCLPNEDEIEQFKQRNASKYQTLLQLLVKNGFYSDFVDYMEFIYNDPIRVKDASKVILILNIHSIIWLYDEKKFAKLHEFIKGMFSNAREASNFKNDIIFSKNCVKSLFYKFCRRNSNPEHFEKLLILCGLTSEQEINQMKGQLLNCFRHRVIKNDWITKYDIGNGWQELLKWCNSNNMEEIKLFKQSLHIDEIFEKQLTNYEKVIDMDSFKIQCKACLQFLDGFLQWYFGDEKFVKDYKLNKIHNYEKIHAINNILRRREHETSRTEVIDSLLDWFFKEDPEKKHQLRDDQGTA